MHDELNAAFTQEDIETSKKKAAVGYLCFLVPLLGAKKSAFARFHANQGFWLQLLFLIVWLISLLFPLVPVKLTVQILYIVIAVCMVRGMMQAMQGQAQETPLIGKIHFLDRKISK